MFWRTISPCYFHSCPILPTSDLKLWPKCHRMLVFGNYIGAENPGFHPGEEPLGVEDERLAGEVEVPWFTQSASPHCKMSAAVRLCWLSLLVLSSHFLVQIDLWRLTFQWTSIVLFNKKLLFRASKEISYKEYGYIILGFFNEIIWSIIWARKMGSSIIYEAVFKNRLLSIPSKHLWTPLWKLMNSKPLPEKCNSQLL